ncbi:MAG: NUDIX domain-containing protein [Clostridia bacterium]|nr:NUDIX domain-containing protein [Clostridia bacterium]
MARDLKVDIDGVRLNVRVGVIVRHSDEVLIEISKIGLNSVVPGGRIKINEHSSKALARELKEEMNFELDENKLKQVKVFENFFSFDGKDVHEIYFLYEYAMNESELKSLKLDVNEDNESTYFKFVSTDELEKYDLLPLALHDIIKGRMN